MNQIVTWCSMGGYSTYVWSAYALAALVLLGNILGIRVQRARTIRHLQQWFKRQR